MIIKKLIFTTTQSTNLTSNPQTIKSYEKTYHLTNKLVTIKALHLMQMTKILMMEKLSQTSKNANLTSNRQTLKPYEKIYHYQNCNTNVKICNVSNELMK